MKRYTKPRIDVLLFDEEEVLTNASVITSVAGYTAGEAVTQMMGDDDNSAGTSGRSITTVNITKIGLVSGD
jgi:hypothetical protein